MAIRVFLLFLLLVQFFEIYSQKNKQLIQPNENIEFDSIKLLFNDYYQISDSSYWGVIRIKADKKKDTILILPAVYDIAVLDSILSEESIIVSSQNIVLDNSGKDISLDFYFAILSDLKIDLSFKKKYIGKVKTILGEDKVVIIKGFHGTVLNKLYLNEFIMRLSFLEYGGFENFIINQDSDENLVLRFKETYTPINKSTNPDQEPEPPPDINELNTFISLNYSIAIPLGNMRNFIRRSSYLGIHFEGNFFLSGPISSGVNIGWNRFPKSLNDTLIIGNDTITGLNLRAIDNFVFYAETKVFLTQFKSKVIPYLGAGIGFNSMYTTASTSEGITQYFNLFTEFGIKLNTGIVIHIGGSNAINFNLNYHTSFTSQSSGEQALLNINYLSMNIGIAFNFY